MMSGSGRGGEGDVSMRLWQCVVLGAIGVLVVGCG